jgi:hypothetical protein
MPPEQPELFHVRQPSPVRRAGYAERPIGRRRGPRFAPASRRSAIASHQLAAIRSLLETHSGLLLDVGAAIEKLTAEVIASRPERRRIGEQLERLLRSQTETRRQLGQTNLHVPLRHSARRPLGID